MVEISDAMVTKRGDRQKRGRPAKTGWEDSFFDRLLRYGAKVRAARATGVSMSTVLRRERRDVGFRALVATLVQDQRLERLRRRGDLLGMLRLLRPEKYGTRSAWIGASQ